MKSLFNLAVASLLFGALFCVHPVVSAQEMEADSTAQNGVAASGSKEQTQDATAKSAKTDKSKKESSSEPEPECNN